MGEIVFKATRRLHDSGYRMLDKSGDLAYDLIYPSQDAIILTVIKPSTIILDCDRKGNYRLKFIDSNMFIHHNGLRVK